jgi:hypothetical protein
LSLSNRLVNNIERDKRSATNEGKRSRKENKRPTIVYSRENKLLVSKATHDIPEKTTILTRIMVDFDIFSSNINSTGNDTFAFETLQSTSDPLSTNNTNEIFVASQYVCMLNEY